MLKLIIQIPCYNEEAALNLTLSELPRTLPGIDVVEWLIVDDGSTDQTVNIAVGSGVQHVVRLQKHCGLAKAFMAGIEACLQAGADVIVNLDADHQYCAADIGKLMEPILAGQAEWVKPHPAWTHPGRPIPLFLLVDGFPHRTRAIADFSKHSARDVGVSRGSPPRQSCLIGRVAIRKP